MEGLRETNIGLKRYFIVKSKIVSHFLKRKISLSPMKTILIIPRELEYLESLVMVARKRSTGETKLLPFHIKYHCCNPNLGLATKTKVCKGASQKRA
jgi:hypothetical protein